MLVAALVRHQHRQRALQSEALGATGTANAIPRSRKADWKGLGGAMPH